MVNGNLKFVLSVAFAAAWLSGFTTEYVVESGDTMELGGTSAVDAKNSNANTIVLRAGATLKLVAASGTANINPRVVVTNGIATLDLSDAGNSPTINASGIRDFDSADAGLRVKGGKDLAVSGTAQFQMHALTFVDGEGQADNMRKLIFNGGIIIAWPSKCPHVIANNATIYLCSPTPLFSGDVTLDTFSMWLYNDTSFASPSHTSPLPAIPETRLSSRMQTQPVPLISFSRTRMERGRRM